VVVLARRKKVVQLPCGNVDLVGAHEAIEEHPPVALPGLDLVVSSKTGVHSGASGQVAFTTGLLVDPLIGKLVA
jgi:hypothetical protein